MKCYNVENRHERKATWYDEAVPLPSLLPASGEKGSKGRWREYTYDELVARDKISLDIFWLRDESLSDSDNLPAPDVIAQEIVDDLEAALVQFREILADVGPEEIAGRQPAS